MSEADPLIDAALDALIAQFKPRRRRRSRKAAPGSDKRILQCPLCGALFLTVETGADGSAPAKEKNAYAELLKHRCPARTFHGRRHHLTETQIAYALTQLPK